MTINITRLNLLKPLYFAPDEGSGEKLFCFELDEAQYRSFEPEKAKFLENPVYGGADRELPQGDYLFAQKREVLSRQEIIDMAVEMQQEGLWQRLEPGKRLYLRCLFEDGCWVTQLFRPYTEPGASS